MPDFIETPSANTTVIAILIALVFVGWSFWRWWKRNETLIEWSDSPLDYLLFIVFVLLWAVGNGLGVGLAAMWIVFFIELWRGVQFPALFHDPVIWFLIGLIPSLQQLVLQINPKAAFESVTGSLIHMFFFFMDGYLTTLGILWYMFPPLSDEFITKAMEDMGNPLIASVLPYLAPTQIISYALRSEWFWAAVVFALFFCFVCQGQGFIVWHRIAGLKPRPWPIPDIFAALGFQRMRPVAAQAGDVGSIFTSAPERPSPTTVRQRKPLSRAARKRARDSSRESKGPPEQPESPVAQTSEVHPSPQAHAARRARPQVPFPLRSEPVDTGSPQRPDPEAPRGPTLTRRPAVPGQTESLSWLDKIFDEENE